MKAIDRAAYWAQVLEQAGFDIECETDTDIVRNEYLTVWARKGSARIVFVIQMNTPRTRFATGARGRAGNMGKFSHKPSDMSAWVSSEVELEYFRMAQEVTA